MERATLTIPQEKLTVDVADAHQLILDSGGALDAPGALNVTEGGEVVIKPGAIYSGRN